MTTKIMVAKETSPGVAYGFIETYIIKVESQNHKILYYDRNTIDIENSDILLMTFLPKVVLNR